MTKKYLIIAALASLILSLGTSLTLHNFISNANTVESRIGLTETINTTERETIYSGNLQLGNCPILPQKTKRISYILIRFCITYYLIF